MAVNYAHGRSVLENSDWSISATTGGSLTASTKYFSLQAANNIGKNTLLVSSVVNIATNNKVVITINSTAKKTGEGWLYYIIGVSDSNDPTTFTQIAKVPIYNTDSDGYPNILSPLSFPLTLELTTDSHLVSNHYVDTVDDLPTTSLLNGMRRGITATSSIYELDIYSTLESDDETVLDAASGKWLKKDSFSVYQETIDSTGGCAVDLLYLTNFSQIELPQYAASGGSSSRVQYYIVNDTGFDLAAGMSIVLNVQVGGYDKTDLFNGKIKYIVEGFANTSTGVLRTNYYDTVTALQYIDIENTYNSRYPSLVLEDVVKTNEAILLTLFVDFNLIEFNGLLPDGYLQILPFVVETVGAFNPVGSLFEKGIIYNSLGKRRVMPTVGLDAIVKSGTGLVKNYTFFKPNEETLYGLTANTNSQKLYVNLNGAVYKDTEESDDNLLRAIVDTTTKESRISDWVLYESALEDDALEVEINFPCDADLEALIRCDYPDVIAGTYGVFNAPKFYLYVRRESSGQIRRFGPYSAVAVEPQTTTLASWSSGTVVGSVPTTSASFYDPDTVNSVSTVPLGGDFAAGDYSVAYSLYWDGNTISDITHSVTNGCIAEALLTGETVFGNNSFSTVQQIRDLTTVYDGRLAYCFNNEQLYLYNSLSIEDDDGFNVLEPTTLTGRWLNQNKNITRTYVRNYDPSLTDDVTEGYRKGDRWVNDNPDLERVKEYTLIDNTENNAIWREVGDSVGATTGTQSDIINLTENTTWYIALDGVYERDGLTIDNPINWTKLLDTLPKVKYNNFRLTLYFKDGVYDDAVTGLSGDNYYLFSYVRDGELTITAGEWVGLWSAPSVTFDYIPCYGDYTTGGKFNVKNVTITNCIDIYSVTGVDIRKVYFDNESGDTCIYAGKTGLTIGELIKFNQPTLGRFVSAYDYTTIYNYGQYDAGGNTVTFSQGAFVLSFYSRLYSYATSSGSGSFVGKKVLLSDSTCFYEFTDTFDKPGSLPAEYTFSIGNEDNLLQPVAFSGSYDDLTDKPVIGLTQTDSTDTEGYLEDKIVEGDNITITKESVDGSQRLKIASTGGGGGLTVVYTTDVTLAASAGNIYLLDGTTTVNLPAGVNGDQIGFVDYDGVFGTSPVTVNRNGTDTILGDTTLVLNVDNACVQLAFHGGKWVITSAQGWLS